MELNTRTAKKALGIEYTLCSNGVINVWSDRGSGDVHSVHLDDTGSVDRCTCLGYTHHGRCYHTDAIEQNGSLRSAARACLDRQTIVTDGGTDTDDPHRGQCPECGETGPLDLDGEPVIMHDKDCPRNGDDTDDERGTKGVHACSTCTGFAHGSDDQCAECQQRGIDPIDDTPL